jgi:hypothetical protein
MKALRLGGQLGKKGVPLSFKPVQVTFPKP